MIVSVALLNTFLKTGMLILIVRIEFNVSFFKDERFSRRFRLNVEKTQSEETKFCASLNPLTSNVIFLYPLKT